MTDHDESDRRQSDREKHRAGLPNHHDPTARFFPGAPPARSALTLRLVLASFGLVVFGIAAGIAAAGDAPTWWVIVLIVVAVIAAIDIAVIIRRKRRGEPG